MSDAEPTYTVGLFILGMHRSGTSALTRMVNLLGVPLCADSDLMLGYGDNPLGHWESRSLAELNEELLHMLHSAWDCPPAAEESVLSERLCQEIARGRTAFEAVHLTGQWAWKDPRLCILLPFWRRVVSGRHVAILELRHPAEIASSLVQRDGLTAGHALAMWERYLRLALTGCTGMPVLVLENQDVLDDSRRATANIAAFLRACGLSTDGDESAASAFVRQDLHHHARAEHSDRLLTHEQRELFSLARTLTGAHRSLQRVRLPPESPEVSPVIDHLRRSWGLCADRK